METSIWISRFALFTLENKFQKNYGAKDDNYDFNNFLPQCKFNSDFNFPETRVDGYLYQYSKCENNYSY